MNSKIQERAKFWDTSYPNLTKEQILEFEKDRHLILPNEYKQLLQQYGKLKFVKTWFLYYELEKEYDHLVSDLFTIEDQRMIWDNYWQETERNNPNLQTKKYLPIFGTHSPNFLFLIGLDKEQHGKIYEYNTDFEEFEPIEIAKSFEDFFLHKIYPIYEVNSKASIGSIDIFKKSGLETWDVEQANLEIKTDRIKISVFSNGKLLKKNDNTPKGLYPKFETQITLIAKINFNNPNEFKEMDLGFSKFEYFGSEKPENLKIGIVKGFKEVYFVKIEGEIKDVYEWGSNVTKFRITFKQ